MPYTSAIRSVAACAEKGRIAKAVLVGAVPPIMLKTAANPEGLPMEVFDGFRAALVANRAQFFLDVPTGPFYGFNRPGAKVSQGLIENWWRQGMTGGAKAHYDCIKAFSETDFTQDLKALDLPVLVLHGEDDQIVPIADSAHKAIKLLKNGTLKTYPAFRTAWPPSIPRSSTPISWRSSRPERSRARAPRRSPMRRGDSDLVYGELAPPDTLCRLTIFGREHRA